MVYHILNLGAGVQSTTLYLFALEGLLHFDYAIFADTQEEPKSVYDHLNWLASLGGPKILVRTKSKLGDDILNGVNSTGQKFITIPAFIKDEHGKINLSQRQCTGEYKINVCDRTIRREILGLKPRQRVPKDVLVLQYFGISLEEQSRAERAKKKICEISLDETDISVDRNKLDEKELY